MKKLLLTIFLLFSNIFAHEQWTHQYIVNEAYSLFEQSNLPGPITSLFESLFKNTSGNFYSLGQPDHPSLSLVAGGAWEEDNFSVTLYNPEFYELTSVPSVNHFWDPDNPDRYANNSLEFIPEPKENAFKKAEYLWNGTGKFLMQGGFQFFEDTPEEAILNELDNNIYWINNWV